MIQSCAGIQPAQKQYYLDCNLLSILGDCSWQTLLRRACRICPDTTEIVNLRQTVAGSQDRVQSVRKRLEQCNDYTSLGLTWKETESTVVAEVGRVSTSFRMLQAEPEMQRLLQKAEKDIPDFTPADLFTMDVQRSMPIIFCLDTEEDLSGIALPLS